MKKVIHIVLAVVLASMTGCASTGRYFADRGRDAADIATVCVGVGAGAKVQIGPVHAGLIANTDLVGLRGGRLFTFQTGEDGGIPPPFPGHRGACFGYKLLYVLS
jgi:hypothetical protein